MAIEGRGTLNLNLIICLAGVCVPCKFSNNWCCYKKVEHLRIIIFMFGRIFFLGTIENNMPCRCTYLNWDKMVKGYSNRNKYIHIYCINLMRTVKGKNKPTTDEETI